MMAFAARLSSRNATKRTRAPVNSRGLFSSGHPEWGTIHEPQRSWRKEHAMPGTSHSNVEKDPDDWVSGDEPITGAQQSYLKTLCEQAHEPYPDRELTK